MGWLWSVFDEVNSGGLVNNFLVLFLFMGNYGFLRDVMSLGAMEIWSIS